MILMQEIERFVNKEIYKKWMSSKLMQGDVILT